MLQWSGTAWTLLTPIAGAQVRATDEAIYITYEGGVWVQTSVPVDQGVDGDALAAVHGNDNSHAISQIAGLQAALDAAGAPSATDNEITAGTVTDTRTVSPAQVKLCPCRHSAQSRRAMEKCQPAPRRRHAPFPRSRSRTR